MRAKQLLREVMGILDGCRRNLQEYTGPRISCRLRLEVVLDIGSGSTLRDHNRVPNPAKVYRTQDHDFLHRARSTAELKTNVLGPRFGRPCVGWDRKAPTFTAVTCSWKGLTIRLTSASGTLTNTGSGDLRKVSKLFLARLTGPR